METLVSGVLGSRSFCFIFFSGGGKYGQESEINDDDDDDDDDDDESDDDSQSRKMMLGPPALVSLASPSAWGGISASLTSSLTDQINCLAECNVM